VICSGYIDEIPESLRWFADALLQKADAPGALLSVVERLVEGGRYKQEGVCRKRK